MRFFAVLILLILSFQIHAEESSSTTQLLKGSPKRVRPRPASEDPRRESSSFIGDAEALDPLSPKRENLKEDAEPVLEDIRGVIDAPKKQAEPSASATQIEVQPSAEPTVSEVPIAPPSVEVPSAPEPEPVEKIEKTENAAESSAAADAMAYNDDDPDTNLENRFHQLYERFNSSPTSDEIWSKLTEGRTSEVYTVQKGDTLWSISKVFFGDAEFWPKIWSLNSEGISNPHFISPGLAIRFFPGTVDQSPTLSVGEPAAEEENTTLAEESEPEAEVVTKVNGSSRQVTKKKIAQSSLATALPDSLPETASNRYLERIADVKIDLGERPLIEDIFVNDLIIADKKAISEIKLPVDDLLKSRCHSEQILKNLVFKRGQVANYSLLEPVNQITTEAGQLYVYRVIGQAQAFNPTALKITNCKSVLRTDIVFVQTPQLALLKTKKMSTELAPQLIGGPDVDKQKLFMKYQIAYLNLGVKNFDAGQTLKIKSQITESVHGEVRILEKFGSYAVGVITNIEDTIEKGDTLLTSSSEAVDLVN